VQPLTTFEERYNSLKTLFWRQPPPEKIPEDSISTQTTTPETTQEKQDDADKTDWSDDTDQSAKPLLDRFHWRSRSMHFPTETIPYTDTISTKLDTQLGRRFVAKMEQLLDIEHLLDMDGYESLMSFVSLLGNDDYFLRK
jgi:hypothetical protein